MENAITTSNIRKVYRDKVVVNDVSMTIPKGHIYGLVGENGAGKTTIMRLISGLAIPNSGTYTLLDAQSNTKEIYKAREKLSAIVEAPSLIPSMTAYDNLAYASLYLGLKINPEKLRDIITLVGLNPDDKKKVKNFSLGMRQRIGIGLSLLNDPEIMILDEPMNGLDPEGIAQLRNLLIKLNQEKGITILISSHILSELEKVATMFGIISHGKLIKEISAEDLRNDCRGSIQIGVDNVEHAKTILLAKGYKDVQLSGANTIRIYDEGTILNDVLIILINEGVIINSVVTNNETIEEYYLRIMKEAK